MSNGLPERDTSVFDRAHPGHQWRFTDELFGMGGLVVASAVDEDYHLVPEADGQSVRRLFIGPHGPEAWSATPFSNPDGDTPDNFYLFSY